MYDKELTLIQKKELLTDMFWDRNVQGDQLIDFISGRSEEVPHITKSIVFSRLLTTYDWYTILKLLPERLLKDALSDDVLNKLYPKELQRRYKYVKKILFT